MKKHSVEVGPLLPRDLFSELGDSIAGKTVLYLPPQTKNVGTELTVRGTIQFFQDHDVKVINDWQRDELPDNPIADCLVYGGGIVGTSKERGSATRRWIINEYLYKTDLPLICLPMTHMGSDEPRPPGDFKMFARESNSLKRLPNSRLAPDLAFYWKGRTLPHDTDSPSGIFLRTDPLAFVNKHWQRGLGDPVSFVNSLDEYFDLASRFEHILTDRLMFATCGLLLGRTVTLMPDFSGKNKAVHEAWLKGICLWSEPAVLLQ